MREPIRKTVLSSDGEHELAGLVYMPDGEPKGYFHMVHGMTEYIARYGKLMSLMADNGYIAFGYDHLGHGRTARNDDELGYFAHKDGWKRLVEDVHVFAESMRAEYGDLPYVLMGHSMGSFIARLAAAEYGGYDKLIVCGTAGSTAKLTPAMAMCKAVKKIGGERKRSIILALSAFGSYNKRFKNAPGNWLTFNLDTLESYKHDKLANFLFTSSAMEDLTRLIIECNRKSSVEKLSKKSHVLLISGTDDPVGDYGKGVRKVYELMKSAGVPVKMMLYKGFRHEILNDDFKQVSGDIVKFVNEK